jgi:predicted dehydrogenase
MARIRMAQYGTGHGHAGGKLHSMLKHPDVEVAGVFEPSAEKAASVRQQPAYQDVHWFAAEQEMLGDDSIVAIASEGSNDESLPQTAAIINAGKHAWYDKPAGEDYPRWQGVVETARKNALHIQLGYMLRYHPAFMQVATWARDGFLGNVFSIRAHMSTCVPLESQKKIAQHPGGIHFDLAGHMLDQIVWMLGRPHKVTSFLRSDTEDVPGFVDNSLVVYEFEQAMAVIDIAAMETRPMARRFEVYGTKGSAILLEPFEPGGRIRLALDEARDGYQEGEQLVEVEPMGRGETYDRELEAFLGVVLDGAEPDRGLDFELLVQETLLRGTGHTS